ncbi:MAG: hypothetical protein M1826_001755 [Phylliscum demangeonii]|nr:MAG: hypothetical protein M1826_001755 [Phylliscum demangeonii]
MYNPVPTPYQSLRFGTFSVAFLNPSVDLLAPHSTPNYAGSSLRGQLLGGEIPTIDFAYPGSTLKSFDLQSLYYACTVNTQTGRAVPLACTIQLSGKKAGTGATVGPKLINFNPPSVAGTGVSTTKASMAFASFSDLTGLSQLTLQIVLSSIPAAQQQTAVLDIDDVTHTNHA